MCMVNASGWSPLALRKRARKVSQSMRREWREP